MHGPTQIPPKTQPPDSRVLDTLPFFEAAARLGSFVAAGSEFGITAAAIAYRVKCLERCLAVPLFTRHSHGVRLTAEGEAYLQDVRRLLTGLRQANARLRNGGREPRLKLVAVEVVAEKWLTPRLPGFKAAHPHLAVEVETDRGAFAPAQREFDAWIAFTDRLDASPDCETLFEETLVPVCSPALLRRHARPAEPRDLHRWPLLYDLAWAPHWTYWFAHHGAPPADLSLASGFRSHSMTVRAAVEGMGVALGHTRMIADELEQGMLVPLFGSGVPAPASYVLCTAPGALERPGVKAFRDWVRGEAARQAHPSPAPDAEPARSSSAGD